LVEDQLISAHVLSNNNYSGNFSSNSSRSSENSSLSNPASTTQQHTMQEIDDRLKKELVTLGLIDQSGLNKLHMQKEDDEICRELKKKQSELLEQCRINQQRRCAYYSLIQNKIEEQEQEKKIKRRDEKN